MTDTASITPFDFEGAKVRTVEIGGEAWFVAKDVAAILGLATTVVARTVEDEDKGLHIMETLQGPQQMVVVNESGLYCLIFRSRKPAARRFTRWVTREVLPALRRSGVYRMQRRAVEQALPWLHDHQLRVLHAVEALARGGRDVRMEELPPITGLSPETVQRALGLLHGLGILTWGGAARAARPHTEILQ